MNRLLISLSVAILVLAPALEAQGNRYETTEIAEGVFRFRYQFHNAFFVVTEAGVVAFDPLSVEAAEQYVREIRKVAPGAELAAVVYSHNHGDHATGADVLRRELNPDAPIIAHVNARAPIESSDNPDQPPPDITFENNLDLHFGGRTIGLHYLGKSHSDDMIVALLPEEGIAFAVDFASHDRVGYRDLGSFHFPDQFTALERLAELDFETIVFGHGPVGDRESVRRQIRYYRDVREAVAEALEKGWTEDQAAERITLNQYSDWGGYEDWFPLNVRGIYRWLAAGESNQ